MTKQEEMLHMIDRLSTELSIMKLNLVPNKPISKERLAYAKERVQREYDILIKICDAWMEEH